MKQILILCFSLFLLLTISCNTSKQAKVTTVEQNTEQLKPSSEMTKSANKGVLRALEGGIKKQVPATSQIEKKNDAGVQKLPKGTKKEGGN